MTTHRIKLEILCSDIEDIRVFAEAVNRRIEYRPDCPDGKIKFDVGGQVKWTHEIDPADVMDASQVSITAPTLKIDEMADPHEEGRDAYGDGRILSANPHPDKSRGAVYWAVGWMEAEEEENRSG